MKRFAVFNPEHDLALSNGDKHFIAPRNIREMGHDLAPLMEFIEGDDILVWGWDHAIKEQLLRRGVAADRLPTDAALTALRECSGRATAHRLLKAFRSTHPDGPYAGESILIHDTPEIPPYATRHGHILLKNPYSSSGKGLRHLCLNVNDDDNSHPIGNSQSRIQNSESSLSSPSSSKVTSWANALIRRHGYLTAEPYYDKVKDFAMEFSIRDGQCRFIGYSLFTTNHHGRYEGNILTTDEKIEETLAQYIPHAALHEVRDWVISHYAHIIPAEWDTTRHPLYFGIDMMVIKTIDKVAIEREQRLLAGSAERSNFNEVNRQQTLTVRGQRLEMSGNSQFSIFNSQFSIHPCVEINLRLNMGIIAHEVRRTLLAPGTEGTFHVTTFPTGEAALQFQSEHTKQYPTRYQEGRITSGYHPLTPVLSDTHHHAYILCGHGIAKEQPYEKT